MIAILADMTAYRRLVIDAPGYGPPQSRCPMPWGWFQAPERFGQCGRIQLGAIMLPRALNHMSVPGLRWDAFLALARSLGCAGVEFRDDLPGQPFGGDGPAQVRSAARKAGMRVLALAEVRAFNSWSDGKRAEAAALMRTAADCGAEAVTLVPRCDGFGCGNGERQANLRVALRELAPMLAERRLVGLIEPLGFETCSLRHKSEAVDGIDALGLADRFRLVHDTFHHVLAGGGPMFAGHTGIVHVSGVTDPDPAISEMRDGHRVLADAHDRLQSAAQVRELRNAGYTGPVSIESFASPVHALPDPARELVRSFEYIFSDLADRAA